MTPNLPANRARTYLHRVFRFVFLGCSISILGVAQSTGWSVASPGFSPEALLNHGDTMWAAGTSGSIASSVDGGQHWKLRHSDNKDGLLLVLGFNSDHFGFAAGTGKRILLTEDGGETWKNVVQAPGPVFQAAFGDTQCGVIRTRDALLSTQDGGKNWTPVIPANDPGWQEKYPNTTSLAALDQSHLIVRVSEGRWQDGEYLYTTDGGATWNAKYLPDGAGSDDVIAVDGAYWSIGGEVVKKNRGDGGTRIPMAIRSKDGLTWEHLPVFYEACHWGECAGCTPQGCFAGRSSFVPFSRILQTENDKPNPERDEPLARFPEHLLSSQWAKSGKILCILANGKIECSTMTFVDELNTREDHAEWSNDRFPPLPSPKSSAVGSSSIEPALKGVHCIRCDLVNLYVSRAVKSGPADVLLKFTIGTDGRVASFDVSGGIPNDVADQVKSMAQGWLFEPCEPNGKPKAINVSLRGRVMVVNPDQH